MNVQIHESVKEHYGKNLKSSVNSCCGDNQQDAYAKNIGYSQEQLESVPENANLGLGCGNPLAETEIRRGDTVLDLGSGAGFDSFIAARAVGPDGKVIGVDMTPEMIDRANINKQKAGMENVDFRLGYIENLPVEANSVDLITSNCVINLSPEKDKVFREAFRVLKPGGILMVSDIVLLKELPWFVRNNKQAYSNCIAGAALKDEYLNFIQDAGFQAVEILEERRASEIFPENDPALKKLIRWIPLPKKRIKKLSGQYAASIKVKAIKPM